MLKQTHASMVAAAKQHQFRTVLAVYADFVASAAAPAELPVWFTQAPITLIASNLSSASLSEDEQRAVVSEALDLAPADPATLPETLASVLVKLAMTVGDQARAVAFKDRADSKKLRTFTPLLMHAATADAAYSEVKSLGLEPTQAEFVYVVRNVSDFQAALQDAVAWFETIDSSELVRTIMDRARRTGVAATVQTEEETEIARLGLSEPELETLVSLSRKLLAASAGEEHVRKVEDLVVRMVDKLGDERSGKCCYLIDGANVAHTNQNFTDGKFSFEQIEEVKSKLAIDGVSLVFLHSKWLKPDANLRMNLDEELQPPKAKRRKPLPRLADIEVADSAAKSSRLVQAEDAAASGDEQVQAHPLVRQWLSAGELCVVPRGVNDDWYWLLASLLLEKDHRAASSADRENPADCPGEVCVVSNDLMRDHLFRMDVTERTWRRFLHRHVCKYKITFPADEPSTRHYLFTKPPAKSRLSQVNTLSVSDAHSTKKVFSFPLASAAVADLEGGWLVVSFSSCPLLRRRICMENVPPILLDKVVSSRYWKERAFALNEVSLIDRVMTDVHTVGFVYGALNKPTPFFCLLVKLLQMKPALESVKLFLSLTHGPCTDDPDRRRDLRYLRVLGACYVRLTLYTSPDLYGLLEPLFSDRRLVNVVFPNAEPDTQAIDSLVEALVKQKGAQPVLGLGLPILVQRFVHEKRKKLPKYRSFLTDVDEGELERAQREWEQTQEEEIGNFQGSLSLSVEETNVLRAKLGLKPLRL